MASETTTSYPAVLPPEFRDALWAWTYQDRDEWVLATIDGTEIVRSTSQGHIFLWWRAAQKALGRVPTPLASSPEEALKWQKSSRKSDFAEPRSPRPVHPPKFTRRHRSTKHREESALRVKKPKPPKSLCEMLKQPYSEVRRIAEIHNNSAAQKVAQQVLRDTQLRTTVWNNELRLLINDDWHRLLTVSDELLGDMPEDVLEHAIRKQGHWRIHNLIGSARSCKVRRVATWLQATQRWAANQEKLRKRLGQKTTPELQQIVRDKPGTLEAQVAEQLLSGRPASPSQGARYEEWRDETG